MPRPNAKVVSNQGDRITLGLASAVMDQLPKDLTSQNPKAKEHVQAVARRVLGAQGVKPHWQPIVVGKVWEWLEKR